MTKSQRTYSAAFREEAVALAREGGTPRSVIARELGVDEETLRRWVLRDAISSSPVPLESLPAVVQEELQRLRKENRVLRMEREILKKATAFFANETA